MSPPATGSQGAPPRRGSSFTADEDAAIARAWISSSENPIIGSEQTGDTFYGKITSVYNEEFKPANRESRSFESIRARTKTIHKQCVRFSGCYIRVMRSKPTGVSPDDLIRLATAMFNDVVVKNASEDCGKSFKFLSAWTILKEHDKFFAAAAENKVTSSSKEDENEGSVKKTDSDSNGDEVGSTTSRRPIGRRKAKELQLRDLHARKKLKLGAELLETQKERNSAIQRDIDIRLFTNSPAGCSQDDSVEFFNILRKEAFARYKKKPHGERTELSPSSANAEASAVTNDGNDGDASDDV